MNETNVMSHPTTTETMFCAC